jgi:hypothetical protein
LPSPSQGAQIVGDGTKFLDHLGIAKIAFGGITAASECEGTGVAFPPRLV